MKEGRKRLLWWVTLPAPGGSRSVFVKIFRAPDAARRLRDRLLGPPPRRALAAAVRLAALGFERVEPLATLAGPGGASCVVTEQYPEGLPTHWYAEGPLRSRGAGARRRFVEALASFVRRLHEGGVVPEDLKDANVLVRERGGTWVFALVDLESVGFGKSRRRRVANLVSLDRTLGARGTRAERLRFLRAYLGAEVDAPSLRSKAREIAVLAARKDREHRRRVASGEGDLRWDWTSLWPGAPVGRRETGRR